jgi:hypothetical protein
MYDYRILFRFAFLSLCRCLLLQERAAIEDWLSRSNISPLTRLPMSVHDLRPNRALKELIDGIRTKHGLVTPTFVSNNSSADIATSLDIK